MSEPESAIPPGYDPDLYRIRHSAAHILAQAVQEHFAPDGAVRLGIGPPIEHGFYYDFELPRPATEADLHHLEARMQEIVAADHPFEVRETSPVEARGLFATEPYKLELLDGLAAQRIDENGLPLPAGEGARITVYQHDGFADLCRGPHVRSTGAIDPAAIKLLHIAGAYWRGDERRPMLQRIYGTAWRTKAELDHYLWQRAEAERRDHRRLGTELELFHFDPTAPGMPYWLPKGLRVRNAFLDFWRAEHEACGYLEVATPVVNAQRLWEISGHWEHYKEEMFLLPVDEHATYGLKPMNCPNAMLVFNLKARSYRELPLRLAEFELLHRHERSGTLHGLFRVQAIHQDDAHIFLAEEQIEEECDRVLALVSRFYALFELGSRLRLGTRPVSFIGDLESWERAEAALRRILDRHVGPDGYVVAEGDGAFYGPKIDILMLDALGRSWQMGTVQIDFQLPRRFACRYADRDGELKTPVVIHRAIYGSLERFLGILLEHTEGALPVWLAPIQARLIPIADAQVPFAQSVAGRLRGAGFRVEVDDSRERMQAKIRAAQLQKVPFMLVVGNREVEADAVAVRLRTGVDLGVMAIDDFLAFARDLIERRVPDLPAAASTTAMI
jgi:threonyl-tRNA synthetase